MGIVRRLKIFIQRFHGSSNDITVPIRLQKDKNSSLTRALFSLPVIPPPPSVSPNVSFLHNVILPNRPLPLPQSTLYLPQIPRPVPIPRLFQTKSPYKHTLYINSSPRISPPRYSQPRRPPIRIVSPPLPPRHGPRINSRMSSEENPEANS